MYKTQRYAFDPEKYEQSLIKILRDIRKEKTGTRTASDQFKKDTRKIKSLCSVKTTSLEDINILCKKAY